MKKFNKSLKNFFPALTIKKQKGFTLAEILLSLTVIGIVAAIALPSLLGSAHERAWETQKKALYTRFSQAIPLLPSLNGYGQLEGTLSQGKEGEDGYIPQNVTVDTAAETFVRDGLSKVMKITNICDSEHLTDCGLPEKIISIDGKNTIDTKTDLKDMQSFNSYLVNSSDPSKPDYEMLNTKAAAFETVNGENILVYYNPNCESNLRETFGHYSQSKMCANFIYDLNGKKGPNTVGKDIGFISTIYSIDPVVVAPVPYPVTSDIYNKVLYKDASAKCKEIDENAKIPNIYEITSIFYNQKLVSHPRLLYWSSDSFSSTRVWVHSLTGVNYTENMASSNYYLRCIKR